MALWEEISLLTWQHLRVTLVDRQLVKHNRCLSGVLHFRGIQVIDQGRRFKQTCLRIRLQASWRHIARLAHQELLNRAAFPALSKPLRLILIGLGHEVSLHTRRKKLCLLLECLWLLFDEQGATHYMLGIFCHQISLNSLIFHYE